MKLVKKIIKKIYHLIWFLSAIFFFIPNVNAAVNIDGANFVQASDVNFADNTNGHLTSTGSTWVEYGSFWRSSNSILTTGGNYGANVAFLSDIPFVQGHTYSVSFLIGLANGYAVTNSASNSRVCIAENTTNAFVRYNNGSFPCTTAWSSSTNTTYYFSDGQVAYQYAMLSFVFIAEYTSNAITFTYTSSTSNESNHAFGGYIVEEISSQPLTQSQIQSAVQNSGLATASSVSQVQQSINQIQSDINSSANDIIDNQQQNTEDIINNQNENTDKQIESQKVCKSVHYSYNKDSSNLTTGKYLNSSGSEISASNNFITPYLKVSEGTVILLQSFAYMNSTAFCFYKKDKSLISCDTWQQRTSISTTAPADTYYIRSTFGGNVSITIDGTFCSDGNQAISDDLNSLNDNITNDDSPDIDLNLNEISDTPISDLLTMPLTILNSLVTNLSDSCSNYTIPFFFNTSVTFPCFTLSDYLGSNVTNYIDLFICLYMCYNIAMLCVSVFDDITSLNDIFNSLYTPKHAYTGYKPKHGGGD